VNRGFSCAIENHRDRGFLRFRCWLRERQAKQQEQQNDEMDSRRDDRASS
jgi:hypothetical protein